MKKSQLSSTLLWLCIVATALIVWRSRQLSSYLEKDRDNYMKAIKEAGKVLVKVKQELDVLNSKSEEALIDVTSVKDVDSQSSKPTPSSQDLATISSINKLKCLQQSKGVIFFYHARKAAGTTIRNILENYSSKYRMQLVESEGVVLMNKFPISSKNIFTITSLRHPIDRIISLYWYEHVAWYNEVKHDMSQCKSLSVWVNAWLDGSSWKQEFITKNSQSTYVEIENYFVKSLSGYVPTTTSIVTREHLEIAKSRLEEFDFIFITELMSDSLHMEAFKMLMEGRLYLKTSPITNQANKIDQINVNQLQSSLAADENEVRKLLMERNQFDLELWEFGKKLVEAKGAAIHKLASADTDADGRSNTVCDSENVNMQLKQMIGSLEGIFRPPGHKGPF